LFEQVRRVRLAVELEQLLLVEIERCRVC
jgi:hypothetical protein